MQHIVLVGLHWLGKSVAAPTLEDAFTQCTIAFERISYSRQENPRPRRSRISLAFLIGSGLDERRAIQRKAKRLYELRSRIVHAGKTDVDHSQHTDIQFLAMRAVVAAAKHSTEMTEQSELREFFDSCKFSGGLARKERCLGIYRVRMQPRSNANVLSSNPTLYCSLLSAPIPRPEECIHVVGVRSLIFCFYHDLEHIPIHWILEEK